MNNAETILAIAQMLHESFITMGKDILFLEKSETHLVYEYTDHNGTVVKKEITIK